MPIDITNKEEKQIALTGVEIEETLLQAHLSKDAIEKINGLEASAIEIDGIVNYLGNPAVEDIFSDSGDSISSWRAETGELVSEDGALKVTGTSTFGRAVTTINTVIGETYYVSALLKLGSGASARIRLNTDINGVGTANSVEQDITSTTFTLVTFSFVATSITSYIAIIAANTSGSVSYFDDIKVSSINSNLNNRIDRIDKSILYTNSTIKNSYDYVRGQEAVCEARSIPVLDLYRGSGLNYENKDNFIGVDNLHYDVEGYQFWAKKALKFIEENSPYGDNSTMSIGVFGGSFSVNTASQAVKGLWTSELGMTYTDYGKGGAGFATFGNYIDSQIDNAGVHNMYVLWCSTNDATKGNEIGTISDATNSTQNGGINLCINKIIAKAPTAKIVLFNTIKSYSMTKLYDIKA